MSPCCAKCRRGIKGYGEWPCGYPGSCPNPNCAHSKVRIPEQEIAEMNGGKD